MKALWTLKYMPSAPSAWVIAKLREFVRDGLSETLCVEQLEALGHGCSARQVKRWKKAHNIHRFTKISDAELDAVLRRVHAAGNAGAREGHRWVHSAVNAELAPLRIGRGRVRKSLLRLFPNQVAERRRTVEQRLIRRVYTRQYYLEAGHLDYNCKATLPGGIKLYTYGHVDGDSRYIAALEVSVVKTAKAAFEEGFLRALETDGCAVSDTIYLDAGREWAVIAYAMNQQGLPYKVVRSTRNVKVERPWGDWNVKCVAQLREAALNLEKDATYDSSDVHDQYALRVAAMLALQAGADEFRERYNEHNVAGPRGGVPSLRRKYRTRPAGIAPAATFDVTRDWAAEYAAATGREYHGEQHFVQYYVDELLDGLGALQPRSPLPRDAWVNIKMSDGRGAFRELFESARLVSQGFATAGSILESECAERRRRLGVRILTEDPKDQDDEV